MSKSDLAERVFALLGELGPWPIVALVACVLAVGLLAFVALLVAFNFYQRGRSKATLKLGFVGTIELSDDQIEELPPRKVARRSSSSSVSLKKPLH